MFGVDFITRLMKMLLIYTLFGALCCCLAKSMTVRNTQTPDNSKLAELAVSAEKRSMHPTNTCKQFAHFPKSISLSFGRLQKVGEGYTHMHCTEMCLATKDFICAGTLIQLPGTCYLTGYDLRNDYFSQHYVRVCNSGPQCFLRQPYKSADFTNRIDVPMRYQSISESFCMAMCEQKESCVGFDFITIGSSPKCMLQDLQKVPDSSFDLYIRRC